MPNQIGGAPPPAGTPNWLVNCGGGSTYRIGNYFPANESFVWHQEYPVAQLEHGQAGWWGAQGGAANNHRMMMIGWVRDYHGDAGPGMAATRRLTAMRLAPMEPAAWRPAALAHRERVLGLVRGSVDATGRQVITIETWLREMNAANAHGVLQEVLSKQLMRMINYIAEVIAYNNLSPEQVTLPLLSMPAYR